VEWILGGETRQESVSRGLEALPAEAEAVLIHDGARCLVEPALLAACVTALDQAMHAGAGIVAATPVTDTIKEVENGIIRATPDRSRLWAAQTPQGFGVVQLRQAHATASAEGWSVTDDAALYERLGLPVRVLAAPPSNIKLTTGFDLTIAAAVLAERFSTATAGSPGPALPRP
jgi:2-C-methyl-D-erythritol 4-phosphate cytidylyltransferase